MKPKIVASLFMFFVTGVLFFAKSAPAQSVAYRQTNLASDIPGLADHQDPFLLDPWGIAVVPGQSFFVANTSQGRAISLDATGSRVPPSGFAIPNPAGTGPAIPVGIVADPNSIFGHGIPGQPFTGVIISATEDGGIYFWGKSAIGTTLPQATLVVDHSRSGAVYTGMEILTPDCCAPFLAVANFHSGDVETFTSNFDLLAVDGTFTDPNLPANYAPYGMQVIGNQLWITYAVQGGANGGPVVGAGNGIVSVFDLSGGFIRRFATGGTLNAPWGIAQASAHFGPFSNDVLVANTGDGTISAFDPATGNFAGQLKDGDGNLLVNVGLHGLRVGLAGVGDPNTLYFTAGIGNEQDGLFGAITTGLVSTTQVSVPAVPTGNLVPITVTVSAGPGNAGSPKGMVTLQDSGAPITDVALTDGALVFNSELRGVGIHTIGAQYHGDDTFLPSFTSTDVLITGPATAILLAAPANAALGGAVTLTATVRSAGGIPTGSVLFIDGNLNLGTAPLDAAGVSIFTINNLSAGAHTLTASYDGNGSFDGSISVAVVTTIANRDFAVIAAPPSATVAAGQATSFNLTVTPSGGFTDNVSFSCPLLAGIACSFSPPSITPNAGAATTTLTVTTSATATHYGGIAPVRGAGMIALFLGSCTGLLGILILLMKNTFGSRLAFAKLASIALGVVVLSVALTSCGGYATNGQNYRGTASIPVTAQSGNISHTTLVQVTVQ